MKTIITILIMAASIFNYSAQEEIITNETTRLIINVEGFEKIQGQVMIGIYDSENNWLGKRILAQRAKVTSDKLTFTFENVPVGKIAVSGFHDENDNNKLDTGWFGIPKEPTACSNGAVGSYGPPKWKDAVFTTIKEGNEITVSF